MNAERQRREYRKERSQTRREPEDGKEKHDAKVYKDAVTERDSFGTPRPRAIKITRLTSTASIDQSLKKLRGRIESARQSRLGNASSKPAGQGQGQAGTDKPADQDRDQDQAGTDKPADQDRDQDQAGTDKPANRSGGACSVPEFLPGGSNDVVKFHQRVVALELDDLTPVTIARATANLVRLSIGFLHRYEQNWEFRRTVVGRPVSYVSLAPLERRRVQVAHKRKTNLSRSDRAKRSSRRTFDSASSTKASNSATNSSTSRNKWSASASGSYGLGGVGFGGKVSGSLEGSSEQSRQMAIQNIAEETQKSSTEVLAETETTTTIGLQTSFEHIEEHQLVNPYADRTVLFSLYELLDEFSVTTTTAGTTPCLVIDFDPVSSDEQRLGPSIKFDESFVLTHRQFLRTALLDDSLIEYLYTQDALQTQCADNVLEVANNADRCLSFLFLANEVFAPFDQQNFQIDVAFNISLDYSGFDDAVAVDLTDMYLLMASVRYMRQRDDVVHDIGRLDDVEYLRRGTEYVIALYNGLKGWSSVSADDRRKMHDDSNKTEQFRRIPAFLELAEQLVIAPLQRSGGEQPSSSVTSAEVEEGQEEQTTPSPPASETLNGPRATGQARVVNHLNTFGRYYTEEYLQFLHEWTGVTAIVELMAALEPQERSLIDLVDFERSFVDGTAWIVPFAEILNAQAVADAFLPADGNSLSALKDFATTVEVKMPANGIHVEAAPGQCILPDLPAPSSGWPPAPAAYLGTNPWIAGSDQGP